MDNLNKFADLIVDTDEIACLTKTTLVLKSGEKQRVSVKAADALREWLMPLELRRLKAQQALPCKGSSPQASSSPGKSPSETRRPKE